MGEIKRFNPVIASKIQFLMAAPVACTDAQVKGYGFISCEAFPEQDVFVLKSELPQGGDGDSSNGLRGLSIRDFPLHSLRQPTETPSPTCFHGLPSPNLCHTDHAQIHSGH